MLVNVGTDHEFQRYLDRMEEKLFRRMVPLLTAGIRIQVNTSGARAEAYVNERGQPVLVRHYVQIYRDGFEAVTDNLETKDASPRTNFMASQLSYLEREAGKQIKNISDTLVDYIRQSVIAAVAAGKDQRVIAKDILAKAPEISQWRAATIARTETHNAALAAIDESLKFKKTPVKSKTWWSAADKRVRPSHQAIHGVTIPYDQPFSVGASEMMRPGDQSLGAGAEEVCNCRCSILFNTMAVTSTPTHVAPSVSLDQRNEEASAQAESFVRTKGKETGIEWLRWTDRATGTFEADFNSGRKDFVSFTPKLEQAMTDPKRQIEVHHNHPSDYPFSTQDLQVLGSFPGLKRLYAHGHLGSRYLATDAVKGIEKAAEVGRKTFVPTFKAMGEGRSDHLLLGRVRTHALMIALDQERWMKYTGELEPVTARYVEEHSDQFSQLVKELRGVVSVFKKIGGGASSRAAKAFIDPPDIIEPLQVWIAWRGELEVMALTVEGLAPFIREADAMIKRKSAEQITS